MVINLQNTNDILYFRGSLTPYLEYRMRLVSKYNNKGILNDAIVYTTNDYFPLTIVDDYDLWYSFSTDFSNTDISNYDIGGYYDCIIEGSNDGSTWTEINRKLVRVFNNWTTDVSYTSNNENNEQFTYYGQ